MQSDLENTLHKQNSVIDSISRNCLKEFNVITRRGIDRLVKPILVSTVDGGSDENPRYGKVIKVAVYHFLQYDFYAVFIATNAPGRSSFNRVERKMAPLSKELTGLIYRC